MPEHLFIKPVATRVVRPEWAARVVSPAYDAIGSDDRTALMDADPLVFLHVTRSASAGGQTEEEALEANAEALARLLDAEVFTSVQEPAVYIYRLRSGNHQQFGVVADIEVDAASDGRVLPHERTRPHRASALADHLGRLKMNSSPVAMAHRPDPVVDALVDAVTQGTPMLDFQREDQLQQTLWQAPNAEGQQLIDALGAHTFYIVDGHHRVAAASEHVRRGGGHRLLVALFPSDQLRTLAFHRRVADLAGASPEALLDALGATKLRLARSDVSAAAPARPRMFGMYLDGAWWTLDAEAFDTTVTDATLLQEHVLGPLLNVDEGADLRLSFLPGQSGIERFVEECDGSGGVAFSLSALSVDTMMALVDDGRTLPPKSTYFEPKVRSGVFVAPRQ